MLSRKQLLNKCQEEFEKGAAAMEAVEAREKAEQAKSKEEKEQDQAEVPLLLLACLLSFHVHSNLAVTPSFIST